MMRLMLRMTSKLAFKKHNLYFRGRKRAPVRKIYLTLLPAIWITYLLSYPDRTKFATYHYGLSRRASPLTVYQYKYQKCKDIGHEKISNGTLASNPSLWWCTLYAMRHLRCQASQSGCPPSYTQLTLFIPIDSF